MAEIEITLPTVQYGNVKVRATPEELGVDIASPAAVGTATAIYLNLFTQGFKVGASMDVTASPTEGLKAPQGAEQSEVAPKVRTVDQILSDEDVDTRAEAQAILDKELGGVTEVPDESTYKSLDDQADTMIKSEGEAPWNQKVAAQPKPWENMDAAPGPAFDDVW